MKKKVVFLLAIVLYTMCVCGQSTVTKDSTNKVVKKSVKKPVVERLDAEAVASKVTLMTKDSVRMFLKGVPRAPEKFEHEDVFYIYSAREKKNIPVEISYRMDDNSILRVFCVTFLSRAPKHGTNVDLKTAFWIEYIRNPYKD